MPRKVNHVLIHPYRAAEVIAAKLLVIHDPTDTQEVRLPEADADTQLVGITKTAAVAANDDLDVVVMGYADLTVDGNVAAIAIGDLIIAHDTAGLGRKITGSAGTNVEAIGYAMEASTADGDVIAVHLAKQTVQIAD